MTAVPAWQVWSALGVVHPVVAVALGAVVLGEPVRPLTLVGGLVTVLAVAVVVTQEGRRRRGVALSEVSSEAQTPVDLPQTPLDRHGRERSSRT